MIFFLFVLLIFYNLLKEKQHFYFTKIYLLKSSLIVIFLAFYLISTFCFNLIVFSFSNLLCCWPMLDYGKLFWFDSLKSNNSHENLLSLTFNFLYLIKQENCNYAFNKIKGVRIFLERVCCLKGARVAFPFPCFVCNCFCCFSFTFHLLVVFGNSCLDNTICVALLLFLLYLCVCYSTVFVLTGTYTCIT